MEEITVAETNPKKLNTKKTVLYSSGQVPPAGPLFFSSLQHMLLILSLGMAMPVSIARTAGLDLNLSGSLLSAALFCMGFSCILQTLKTRFIGAGYQSMSVADSAALSAIIAEYKLRREDFVEVIPAGACPDGFSLTGFYIRGIEHDYYIGLREDAEDDTVRIPVDYVSGSTHVWMQKSHQRLEFLHVHSLDMQS